MTSFIFFIKYTSIYIQVFQIVIYPNIYLLKTINFKSLT